MGKRPYVKPEMILVTPDGREIHLSELTDKEIKSITSPHEYLSGAEQDGGEGVTA